MTAEKSGLAMRDYRNNSNIYDSHTSNSLAMLVRHALTLNRFIHDLSWITIIAFLDSLDNELAVISAVIVIAEGSFTI